MTSRKRLCLCVCVCKKWFFFMEDVWDSSRQTGPNGCFLCRRRSKTHLPMLQVWTAEKPHPQEEVRGTRHTSTCSTLIWKHLFIVIHFCWSLTSVIKVYCYFKQVSWCVAFLHFINHFINHTLNNPMRNLMFVKTRNLNSAFNDS